LRKVEILGQVQQFEILHLFEFNSDRKRMSVIVRDPNGIIKMYTKGADSIIKARLDPESPQPFLKTNQKALNHFSKKGLRTLLVAMRVIDPSEYEEIRAKWREISKSTHKEEEISILLKIFVLIN
jgi:phospholipid-translocating ATPase